MSNWLRMRDLMFRYILKLKQKKDAISWWGEMGIRLQTEWKNLKQWRWKNRNISPKIWLKIWVRKREKKQYLCNFFYWLWYLCSYQVKKFFGQICEWLLMSRRSSIFRWVRFFLLNLIKVIEHYDNNNSLRLLCSPVGTYSINHMLTSRELKFNYYKPYKKYVMLLNKTL